MAVACTAFVVFAAFALRLLAYPHDWSPDEGLAFEQAVRLGTDPASLYARSFVPYPAVYGLGLPLLLAPLLWIGADPLLTGRLLAIGWTVAFAGGVYTLVRRGGGRPLALAISALALLPLTLSFWHLVVRPDGLMHALWLLAALPLLPQRLERGADRLDARRITLGCALLFAATLAKPTAVLHGAPLVLGWLLVDVRGFVRLVLALFAVGVAWLGLMQGLTDGGYLWVTLSWSVHHFVPGQTAGILRAFASHTWPAWLLVGAGVASRWRSGGQPWTESAWLLLAGGLAAIPILGKGGATAHYLLPLLTALPLLAGRLFGDHEADGGSGAEERPLATEPPRARAPGSAWREPPDGGSGAEERPLATEPPRARAPGSAWREPPVRSRLGGALAALAILISLALHPGNYPTRRDEATARTFYDYVLAHSRDAGRPLLAITPDWPYFLAGQAAVTQGAAFPYLAEANLPGMDGVLRDVQAGRYGAIVTVPDFWPWQERWRAALRERYTMVGACRLGYYYGDFYLYLIFVPQGDDTGFAPPPGTSCASDYRALAAGQPMR
ncbi:MAG: hypothetical protein NDJ94_06515 [Vicinamibacteria bacterium]|nr:hypothetical protein [Vicinamibacteria bacterium]